MITANNICTNGAVKRVMFDGGYAFSKKWMWSLGTYILFQEIGVIKSSF